MKKRGLTMIELLIVMTLLAVIMPIIVSVYITGIRTYNQELTQAQLQSDAQTILDEILNDTKNAQSIEASYNSYTTGADTIILRVPAINANQVIQYNGTEMLYDRIIYHYENKNIHKLVYADPSSARFAQNNQDKLIASNVLILNFTYNPDPVTPTLVAVNVSNTLPVANLVRTVSVNGEARLRNHI